jgi:Ca2+-binding EF-hand superfamily protein
LSKAALIRTLTEGERAERYDMTIDNIRDIDEAFNLYAKKEKTDPSNKTIKIPQLSVRPDLDNAMRKLGHSPGEIELNEIRNQLDAKREQEMKDVKIANKKQ